MLIYIFLLLSCLVSLCIVSFSVVQYSPFFIVFIFLSSRVTSPIWISLSFIFFFLHIYHFPFVLYFRKGTYLSLRWCPFSFSLYCWYCFPFSYVFSLFYHSLLLYLVWRRAPVFPYAIVLLLIFSLPSSSFSPSVFLPFFSSSLPPSLCFLTGMRERSFAPFCRLLYMLFIILPEEKSNKMRKVNCRWFLVLPWGWQEIKRCWLTERQWYSLKGRDRRLKMTRGRGDGGGKLRGWWWCTDLEMWGWREGLI